MDLVCASTFLKSYRNFDASDAKRCWPGGCNVVGKGTKGKSCKVHALQPAGSQLSLLSRAPVPQTSVEVTDALKSECTPFSPRGTGGEGRPSTRDREPRALLGIPRA